MKIRKVDENNDMLFGNGRLNFYNDEADGVAQAVVSRLRLFKEEWFLDVREGTPWVQLILGKQNIASAVPAIKKRILETPNVQNIESFDVKIDNEKRELVFHCELNTAFGNVDFYEVL